MRRPFATHRPSNRWPGRAAKSSSLCFVISIGNALPNKAEAERYNSGRRQCACTQSNVAALVTRRNFFSTVASRHRSKSQPMHSLHPCFTNASASIPVPRR